MHRLKKQLKNTRIMLRFVTNEYFCDCDTQVMCNLLFHYCVKLQDLLSNMILLCVVDADCDDSAPVSEEGHTLASISRFLALVDYLRMLFLR